MRITSPNYTSITSATPKVVETGNGFLINTQYYTKEKLSAVALEFLKVQGSPYALSIRKQLYLQSANWRFPHDEVEIFKDSTYQNRYYIRIIGGYIESTTITSYLVTIEEAYNKEFKCLNISSFSELCITDIFDQDENFLYIGTRGSNTSAIYTINKSTFVQSKKLELASQARGYVNISKLYSDDTNIFFMYFYEQNIYTLVYNKATQTYSTSTAIYRGKETTPAPNVLTVMNDSVYEIDKNTSGLFLFNSADPQQPIDLYCYDRTKPFEDGFTMKPVNIVWNDNKSQIDFIVGNLFNTIRFFISEFDGVKYLNLVSYSANYSVTTYANIQGIYTFRIDSDTELTFVGFNPIDRTKLIGGFIYDASKEHLIMSRLNSFQVLKFNKEKLVYENTSAEVPSCYSVGLDELQRIWYVKIDSSTHMINLEDAQSVDIRFEKEYYDYTGSSIDTYVAFSALNYLGEEFAGTFELSLSGPAVFTENGENTIKFVYNGEGQQQIGLTITGASPITIYPKFIKNS